jgi:hypothetical protein
MCNWTQNMITLYGEREARKPAACAGTVGDGDMERRRRENARLNVARMGYAGAILGAT